MAVPINLDFEAGTDDAGQALGWTVSTVATATLYADYGRRVVFDASGAPDGGGLVPLPSWLTITCATAQRSIQTGPATARTGFAANTARARSLDGTTWGVAVEKPTTNLADEQDLTNWTAVNGATVASATAPNGAARNIEATDPNAGAVSSLTYAITPGVVALSHTLSGWRNILTAPTTDSRIEYLDGANDPSIVSAAADAAFVFVSTTVANIDDGSFTITPRATTIADTGATRWWGVQLEQSVYPTSFIGDDNATFARAVDVLTVTDPEVIAPSGYFTLTITLVPHYASTEVTGTHNLLWFDTDNRLSWDGAAGTFVLRLDGVDLSSAAATFSRNQVITITVRHQADGASIEVAGATTGDGITTGAAQNAITLPSSAYLLGTNLGAEESADLRSIEVLGASKQAVEDFESGWSNTPLILTIPTAELELAGYSAPPLVTAEAWESFERGATYLTEIGTKENATYGIGSTGQAVETFNEQWAEVSQTFTANAGADEIDTSAAHLLTVGRMVRFTTTGTLPGNLTSTDPFYVVTVVDATTIQVSATPAGAPIDILDAGTGTHTIHAGTQPTALLTIPPAELELAVYDAGGSANAFESFEMADGWDASYVTTIASLTLALYYSGNLGGTQAFEDFESIRLRSIVSVLPATDKVLLTAHPFSNGEIVKFVGDGRLPDGLNEEVTYYVLVATANDFEVELVSGLGNAVDITDTGAGTSRVVADETRWFTIDLGPV